jgi:hypothetical protein
MPYVLMGQSLLELAGMTAAGGPNNIWNDFNDVGTVHGLMSLSPDIDQLKVFLDVVFGYCEGLIPVRGFVDKGQGKDGRPNNIWIEANEKAVEKLATFAAWASREGAAVYVVPGTVSTHGQARAEDVIQMQTILVDLDDGDVPAKYNHLVAHLGEPTLLVESGGRTRDGHQKCHVWWLLSEPATGSDIELLCQLRGEIAVKIGGDRHFRSSHQPIRVAGSIYQKGGSSRLVSILDHNSRIEWDLREFAEAVAAMPAFGSADASQPQASLHKPSLEDVLTKPVREGGSDAWTRFEGASAAIGHFIRLVHEGRISPDEGWEAICQYNAAMLRPAWSLDRLQQEADRLWALHIKKNGPALIREPEKHTQELPVFSLGSLIDDQSPMPEDIIAPRVLTPGGLLVLGGAPKVGKSDFLISLLAHMAAGIPFLGFKPPRALRIFYLQAEIQYHYLRERMQQIRLDAAVIKGARDRLFATPKLRMVLDERGLSLVAQSIRDCFQGERPDIICLDPIRNLFDGGPDSGGENDNAAMMFFLNDRVEKLRESVAPDCGVILAHHTRKMNRKLVSEDPFQALSGASALRGFYTSGLLMHRPDEESTRRRLEIELRNGPAMASKLIDKEDGRWVEISPMSERLVRKDMGAKLDAERLRKGGVIVEAIFEEAAQGRLYTTLQFAEKFENTHGLGGKDTIRDRISVLATKGFIKFLRNGAPFGFPSTTSRFGYVCVEGMRAPAVKETTDEQTGEIYHPLIPVIPSTIKCPHTGVALPDPDPDVWAYAEDGE